MSIVDDHYKISYAQNREDVILEAFFPDVEKGTYVDVGANHPIRYSVTKLFYDKGWRGINLEPHSDLFKIIEKHRPEDVNLNTGLGSKAGKLSFRIYHSQDGLDGFSTFSTTMKKSHEQNNKSDYSDDISVGVKTLMDVLQEHPLAIIHFLKIDVVGYEYEVLQGNDWTKFRPQMICIATNHLAADCRKLLSQAGYKTVFNDGLNDYLLAEEAMDRINKFNYAKAMLLEKPIISYDVSRAINELEQRSLYSDQKYQQVRLELTRLEHDYSQAVGRRNELYKALDQYSTLRKQLLSLASQTHKRILIKIEKLREPRRAVHAPKLRISQFENKTTEELLRIAANYDNRHLIQRSPYIRPRYLLSVVLIYLYRLVARAAKNLVKLLLKIKGMVR